MNTTLKLKTLIITNFKGIQHFTVQFDDVLTHMSAQNGKYKTSLYDAYLWLLFGKDSMDRADFNIKNTVITELNRQDHEVYAIIDINGVENSYKKVYKENWTKKRGSETTVLTGHTTECYINDVPLSIGEYQKRISEIIDEQTFKLISNPIYFNQKLKWQDRRNILIKLGGDVTNDMVFERITKFDNKDRIDNLIHVLNSGKSFDDYKKEIGAKKKKLRESLESIPIKISEASRSKPQSLNWNEINAEINTKEQMIVSIDKSMQDSVSQNALKNEEIIIKQNQLNALKGKLSTLQSQIVQDKTNNINLIKNEIKVIETDISGKESVVRANQQNITNLQNAINTQDEEIKKLYSKAEEIEKRTAPIYDFKANTFNMNEQDKFCPTCLREVENLASKIEQMETDFNTNEAKRKADYDTNYNHWVNKFKEDNQNELNKVIEQGKSAKSNLNNNKSIIEEANKTLQKSIEELELIKSNLQIKKDELSKVESIQPIETGEIINLKNEINSFIVPTNENTVDYISQNEQKQAIQKEIDELKKQLNTKEQIEVLEKRIDELKNEESTQSQELAELERIEFTLNDFDKGKMELTEESINGLFEIVKFKMYNKQLNDGESQTCETMLDGVPYSDVNTAGKINAGIDIINALSKYYGVSAPIFIDNKESINTPLKSVSQVVYLSVGLEECLTILK
jgi:exonuclease SbcC